MSAVSGALETFEGKGKRILWLPAITLGYIFTLSGAAHHFWLAVLSMGGAKFFLNFLDSDLVKNAEDREIVKFGETHWWFKSIPMWKNVFLLVLTAAYAGSVGYGGWLLYQFFDHSDPIIVGLSVIYWGGFVIIFTDI